MSVEILREAAALIRERDLFWEKVRTHGECWEWTAAKSSNGYGRFWSDGRFVPAHRYAYEIERGPIPAGLVVDHLCRNRLCVRVSHLEAVTHRENVRRGAKGRLVVECANGHAYTPENTYVKPNGCRDCRICRVERKRRYRRERQLA